MKLDYFPVNLTTWQEWREQHPDTTVLSRDTGVYPPDVYQSENDPSSFYFDYRNSPRTMFPVWQRDDSLDPKDQVIIVRAGGVSKAYSLRALQSERIVNDAVGGVNVVLVSGSATTLSAAAYERGGEVFAAPPGYLASDPNGPPPQELRDSAGGVWRIQEHGLINQPDSTRVLTRVPTHEAYWFGWYAFHPDTELYTGPVAHPSRAHSNLNNHPRVRARPPSRLSVASEGFAEPLSSRDMTDWVVFIFRATSCCVSPLSMRRAMRLLASSYSGLSSSYALATPGRFRISRLVSSQSRVGIISRSQESYQSAFSKSDFS